MLWIEKIQATTEPIEWLLAWTFLVSFIVSCFALIDTIRDYCDVKLNRWRLTSKERKQILPVARYAVVHEALRVSKQFVGMITSISVLFFPSGQIPFRGEILRWGFMVISVLMLITSLHGLRARHRYFSTVRKLNGVTKDGTPRP